MKDTMKKHLLYTVLTFVCAAAVSCTDFLQTESASTKSTESVFETESDVKKPCTECMQPCRTSVSTDSI